MKSLVNYLNILWILLTFYQLGFGAEAKTVVRLNITGISTQDQNVRCVADFMDMVVALTRKETGTAHLPTKNFATELAPGVRIWTGAEIHPYQKVFIHSEIPDPKVIILPNQDGYLYRDGKFVGETTISGTHALSLKFDSPEAFKAGGPYQYVESDFHLQNGKALIGPAQDWDRSKVAWRKPKRPGEKWRLWKPETDQGEPPVYVWYGGGMKEGPGGALPDWSMDNFKREVFSYIQDEKGQITRAGGPVIPRKRNPNYIQGNYLDHGYGIHIIEVDGKPHAFYERVTKVHPDGSPAETHCFMDEMISPFESKGEPIELFEMKNPKTGKPFPSFYRRDGNILAEGPIYIGDLPVGGKEFEAVGFSTGDYFASYRTHFAIRPKGSKGPFQLVLNEAGTDLKDFGAEISKDLGFAGLGRPAPFQLPGQSLKRGEKAEVPLLAAGFKRSVLPDNDFTDIPKGRGFHEIYRHIIELKLELKPKPGSELPEMNIKYQKSH